MDIHNRLVLIGDAGIYLDNHPTLAALGQWTNNVRNASVLFLGDNIYDDGLIEEERVEAERILAQQLSATSARKILVPGNHDWGMNPAKQNLTAILN
ncbi:MAG: metallophosphoesterase [Halioglobus sp.]